MKQSFKKAIVTFPFGKYKDYDVRLIPDDYLAWVLENIKDLDKDLRKIIKQELIRRANAGIVIDSAGNKHGEYDDEVGDGLNF